MASDQTSVPSYSMLRTVRVPVQASPRALKEVVFEALAEEGYPRPEIPLQVLRDLPAQSRLHQELDLTVVRGPEETVLISANLPYPLVVAVDVGSTNVDAWLVHPESLEVLASGSCLNPQSHFSEDILDRILHSGDRMDELRVPLVAAINGLAREICHASGRQTSDVALLCVAGNTAMMHLLLGVEATALPVLPNTPVFHNPGLLKASDAGFSLHPEARLYLLPNVGAFVGGDIVADLLAVGLHRSEEVSILVDVGTNAEVVIGNRNWLLCGAGAAGPALEGGVASAAGRARPGAVDRCRFDPEAGAFVCSVLGGGPPTHFCGSGLIELVGELYRHHLIDGGGRFVEGKLKVFQKPDGSKAVEVVPSPGPQPGNGLSLSEHDLQNFVRSKAGMYALIQTLLSHVGLAVEQVGRVYVCGAFGNRIPADTAVFIGMMPPLPSACFRAVEDAALQGIVKLLGDTRLFSEIAGISEKMTYLDMNTDPLFMKHFTAARFIPHSGILP